MSHDNSMVQPSRCGTCKHWKNVFPENQGLGVCSIMGITKWSNDRAHVSVGNSDIYKPQNDFQQCSTLQSFGCLLHSDYLFMQIAGSV